MGGCDSMAGTHGKRIDDRTRDRVARLLAEGLSMARVAERLNISRDSVKNIKRRGDGQTITK